MTGWLLQRGALVGQPGHVRTWGLGWRGVPGAWRRGSPLGRTSATSQGAANRLRYCRGAIAPGARGLGTLGEFACLEWIAGEGAMLEHR